MMQPRHFYLLWLSLLVTWSLSSAFATSGTIIKSPHIDQAQKALADNLALGDSLAGRPATPAEVARVKQLLQTGLEHARALVKQYPEVPISPHLLGSFLCLAYYPVEVAAASSPDKVNLKGRSTRVILQKGNPDPKKRRFGVTELERAITLGWPTAPYLIDFRLDRAEALLVCSDVGDAELELSALNKKQGVPWSRQPNKQELAKLTLTSTQQLRLAKLFVKTMALSKQPDKEAEWLKKVIALDPKDKTTKQRLHQLQHK